MQDRINRRQFLKTGTLVGTLAVGSPLALLAPSRAWALEMGSFNKATGQTLLQFCRHIFPHDTMDDAVYALVIKDLDSAATAEPAIKELLQSGVDSLNQKAGGDWLGLDAEQQFAIVEAESGTAYFEKVRSTAVVSLYNNPLAFAHFGYEGESFSQGGYLHRGFQSLDWLETPPADASPAA